VLRDREADEPLFHVTLELCSVDDVDKDSPTAEEDADKDDKTAEEELVDPALD
jgi:hypothetical protein